jgi:hypothetical protein
MQTNWKYCSYYVNTNCPEVGSSEFEPVKNQLTSVVTQVGIIQRQYYHNLWAKVCSFPNLTRDSAQPYEWVAVIAFGCSENPLGLPSTNVTTWSWLCSAPFRTVILPPPPPSTQLWPHVTQQITWLCLNCSPRIIVRWTFSFSEMALVYIGAWQCNFRTYFFQDDGLGGTCQFLGLVTPIVFLLWVFSSGVT